MHLVERVKGILLTPRPEWEVIAGESTTPAAVFTGYVLPLAAIGPIAQVIGFSVLGTRLAFGGSVYRTPIGTALTSAVVTYVFSLVGVFVAALIIDALAPTFGGTKSPIQALKTAAYSSTAVWVAGIFTLVPGLRVLYILGLYSVYLLYLGLPITMRAPVDRAGAYTGVVVVVQIVLFFLARVVGRTLMGSPAY